MVYCGKLFEALDKKLEERKNLDQIGEELCDTVKDPRDKAIRLIKAHKSEKWLKDNSEWLGYQINHTKKSISSKKFDDGTNDENRRQVSNNVNNEPLPVQMCPCGCGYGFDAASLKWVNPLNFCVFHQNMRIQYLPKLFFITEFSHNPIPAFDG